MRSLHLFGACALALLVGAGACGDDEDQDGSEAQCADADECPEVTCPDGLKGQACVFGMCSTEEDFCGSGSGGAGGEAGQ